jgi:hypothetical protein
MAGFLILIVIAILAACRSTQRCQICQAFIKRTRYQWTIRSKKVYVCPHCNAKLERIQSRLAFDPSAKVKFPDIGDIDGAGKSTGCVSTAVNLILVVFAVLLVIAVVATAMNKDNKTFLSTPRPNASAAPFVTPEDPDTFQPKEEHFASVDQAQREAVHRYPELGRQSSAFNLAFRTRYEKYRKVRPELFGDNAWPLQIAEEVDKEQAGK